jgi:hypothetical protein
VAQRIGRRGERGATVAEFAVVALLFFMMIIGIIEFGRLLYTHNALTDATRRGARFAVINQGTMGSDESNPNRVKVKNYVVYGASATYDDEGMPTSAPLINGLTTDMVKVTYEGADLDGDPDTDPSNFGANLGTATVSIEGYEFDLSVPLVSRDIPLPTYTTTLIAECEGEIPADIAP